MGGECSQKMVTKKGWFALLQKEKNKEYKQIQQNTKFHVLWACDWLCVSVGIHGCLLFGCVQLRRVNMEIIIFLFVLEGEVPGFLRNKEKYKKVLNSKN